MSSEFSRRLRRDYSSAPPLFRVLSAGSQTLPRTKMAQSPGLAQWGVALLPILPWVTANGLRELFPVWLPRMAASSGAGTGGNHSGEAGGKDELGGTEVRAGAARRRGEAIILEAPAWVDWQHGWEGAGRV